MDPVRAQRLARRLKQRNAAETRFKVAGFVAVLLSAVVLASLLFTMTANGIGGFRRAVMEIPVDLGGGVIALDPSQLVGVQAQDNLKNAGLPQIVADAANTALGKDGGAAISDDAWRDMAKRIIADPALIGTKFTVALPASDELASGLRGTGRPEMNKLAARLRTEGKLHWAFDPGFLVRSDATSPQQVGIWGALKGSLFTMLVTLGLAFPIGVLAAVYLEEYAPKNRWTDIIEVSINNLAAVPSIIFGLLGLAVFLAIFPNYRSAPLIGGMTLALMTMPVIVISGRNAIKAVPPSIRDAALAIGASRVQTVFHHVLPLALPGILTGTIIGMARALGETAPLLMIGMRAFVATPPEGLTSPATVLPVQIFLWSDEIDRGFVERTSAAIIVLLLFLLAMNGVAIYLRNRFEKRW
ncbi:MAG: phosphate ABC transporter permease PstA [Sphingomonadales bacterium]|nr:phosphate ABC transporter permease PstA [Sphingomonadales bacterium]